MSFGPIENFSEACKVTVDTFVNLGQNLQFRHILFLKSIFHIFLDFIHLRFSLRTFCSTQRMIMIRRALHSSGSMQPLEIFRCVAWTHGKFFRGLQSHCRHVLSTLATLDKSIFEFNFSFIFRFYSP